MRLERYCYAPRWTLGKLHVGNDVLHTLERPWVAGSPGGMPFVSCIPDGTYQILPHVRPNGDYVLALRNPNLGVWYSTTNVPDSGGRYLILLHSANYVEQVQGCIAPGIDSIIHENRVMVTSSRRAMKVIMDYYEEHEPDELAIEPCVGTKG